MAPDGRWIQIITGLATIQPQEKTAYSPTLRGLGEIAGYLPGGRLSWGIPGVPKHLQGMLAGGLLGAGIGYGTGYLAEQMLPDSWQKGRLRKTLALLGGALGAAPGVGRMAVNTFSGKSPLFDSLGNAYPDNPASYLPVLPNGAPNPAYRPDMPYVPKNQDLKTTSKFGEALATIPGEIPEHVKQAVSQTGYELLPPVDLNEIQQSLWNDPLVSHQLPLPTRAATSGLLETAWSDQQRRGAGLGGARLVWPSDIARITAGMGTGYLSATLLDGGVCCRRRTGGSHLSTATTRTPCPRSAQ